MDSPRGSRIVPSEAPPAASKPRTAIGDRLSQRLSRGRQAATALVLVASALFAGPVSPAAALAPSEPAASVITAPESAESREAERLLSARLATEYAGAVSAAAVESLVRGVSSQLRRDASLADRLLHTTELVCRRALTDFLAVGVPLPTLEA